MIHDDELRAQWNSANEGADKAAERLLRVMTDARRYQQNSSVALAVDAADVVAEMKGHDNALRAALAEWARYEACLRELLTQIVEGDWAFRGKDEAAAVQERSARVTAARNRFEYLWSVLDGAGDGHGRGELAC